MGFAFYMGHDHACWPLTNWASYPSTYSKRPWTMKNQSGIPPDSLDFRDFTGLSMFLCSSKDMETYNIILCVYLYTYIHMYRCV